MGCFLAIISVFMPRIAMVAIFFLTNWFALAFQTKLWPIVGFILMPYTTLVYMGAMIYNHHSLTGAWLIALIIAVLFDIGGQGGSVARR